MRRVTIAVIGNAKTTRANLDALLSDFMDAVDEVKLALVYEESPSDGQTWAKQFADEKSLVVEEYPNNAYEALFKTTPAEDLKFFILWDDEDSACQLAASWAQANRIMAYDLTNGLMMIPLSVAPIAKPTQADIPEVETAVSEEPTAPSMSQDDDEDDEEEAEDEKGFDWEDVELDDEQAEFAGLVTEVIERAAKLFAKTFAEELIRLLKK